jgi:hypothetical protein
MGRLERRRRRRFGRGAHAAARRFESGRGEVRGVKVGEETVYLFSYVSHSFLL